MEQKKNSESPSFSERMSFNNKSFLDLSTYSKANYNKQNSINNTSEICEYFTCITNNQKDISKKYDQLFSLIKKFGKEIKYLLDKNDEYNNILIDTKEYIKKIKTKLSDSSCNEFENIERKLFEDRNNVDVIGQILVYFFEELQYYNKNSFECNQKINDIRKSIGSKDECIKLERQLTLKNDELKKEIIDSMNSLKENHDLKLKLNDERNMFKKDLEYMNLKILDIILKLLVRDKIYHTKKNIFFIWLNIIRRRKEAKIKIINIFCKNQNQLLSCSFNKLKAQYFEKYLIDKISSMMLNGYRNNGTSSNNSYHNSNINPNINSGINGANIYSNNKIDSKARYYADKNTSKDRKGSVFSNLNSHNKMKSNNISLNSNDNDYDHMEKKSESSFYHDKKNSQATRKTDLVNLYDTSDGSRINSNDRRKKKDTIELYNDDNENNNYEKSISLFDNYTKQSNYNIEKLYENFQNEINEKADQKNVDMLNQTIKKLNHKINDILAALDKQKKINERLSKNITENENSYSNYKSTTNYKLSPANLKSLNIDNNESSNLLSEKTLSEYLTNKNTTSRNESINNDNRKNTTNNKKKQNFDNDYDINNKNSNRRNKIENMSHKTTYDNIDKWKNNNKKYSKNNSMDVSINNSNLLYPKEYKSNHRRTSRIKNNHNISNDNVSENKHTHSNSRTTSYNNKNDQKISFIENSNDSANTLSDIKLILRTGGGFRKLSEHDQKHYIEKLNYLNDNNLLGYETNLNIKIKGHPFMRNANNNNNNHQDSKKEKRHRSLSKFYNMH
ncbi:conserved Plasmodium protein, unknown function [Plasmodium yoelii]|uniref:Uncharacterized protein n=3 Tax=Plasmodium yoelii TaxID=5861 RepID=A0AAE9WT84_PLAYO|nr:conserved Plasmodium protein, unknown function [Plasmodium yoelii]WBY59913.1 hypothetical protein Py17XNL_001303100 [Plasmodium yoelii yoelii]CDU19859.1 conserved Plasmodium protein, unknown function [Plasmodium yoelii]VTZ80616.1 conserved Plasmodium protein, unknown function [Plasmodium yoelii]|eukprot:XP_022813567.1 conserved Plasmodium protein, unknown function [Plasmodium yoelii]